MHQLDISIGKITAHYVAVVAVAAAVVAVVAVAAVAAAKTPLNDPQFECS